MSVNRWSLLAVLALSFSAVLAQPAPAASAPNSMMNCGKSTKHDHSAEKGMPKPMSAQCPEMATGAASGAAKKPLHDHQKFHK